MDKSYAILYSGDISTYFIENNISNYMLLNGKLAVVYVDENFQESVLDTIPGISYYSRGEEMSSLINITNRLDVGITPTQASGVSYVQQNPYITSTGRGIIVAIIDSGIDYLHPDFINEDNTSKIVSIWDQSSNTQNPPNGAIFGSEFTREDINRAIEQNDDTLTRDEIGTGTIAAGICSGRGELRFTYAGVAPNSELVVVKLRQYDDRYKEGIKNYVDTDFLSGIKYVLDVARREGKSVVINLTVAVKSSSQILTNYLETFEELSSSGVIVVSGSGNEGNTDIHYKGSFMSGNYEDVRIQVGQQHALRVTLYPSGPDKIGASIISPSGEVSLRSTYAPDNYIYTGRFNLENSTYEMRLVYPWIFSGNQELTVFIEDIKPGIWTLRLYPEFIINGEFDIYLPNKKLISENTRFIYQSAFSTITRFANVENVITVGTYDTKTDGLWVGSSKGSVINTERKPDIVASGVDIISTFINQSYTTATGTGVSSSVVCGALAIIMEYLAEQGPYERSTLYTQVLKTYLMLGADKRLIYTYPNESEGYGNMNLENTIKAIADLL